MGEGGLTPLVILLSEISRAEAMGGGLRVPRCREAVDRLSMEMLRLQAIEETARAFLPLVDEALDLRYDDSRLTPDEEKALAAAFIALRSALGEGT